MGESQIVKYRFSMINLVFFSSTGSDLDSRM